jgi:dTDP-4-dehydrorhamnose reductase
VTVERWLVTGASGFLGANAGAFLSDRVDAVALGRRAPGVGYRNFIEADLRDVARLQNAVDAVAPQVILHTAALSRHEDCESDPELARAVNVAASGTLAEAARRAGARFIYISTDAVFDGERGHYSEGDEPHPFSAYGQTKLAGEHAVRDHLDPLIVRTNFFGWSPSGTRSILEFFLGAHETTTHVKGYTDFVVTSAYVQSLLEGIWALHLRGTTGVVHVASKDAVSKYDFALAVAREFDLDPGFIDPVDAPDDIHLTSRNRDISLDVSLFERLTRTEAPTQMEGLRKAHADVPALRRSLRDRER